MKTTHFITAFLTIFIIAFLASCGKPDSSKATSAQVQTPSQAEIPVYDIGPAKLDLAANTKAPAPSSHSGWIERLDDAKLLAKNGNKHILIDFTGSDWCGWCIRLDKEVFSQEAFKRYAKDNLILVELDFPRNKPQSAEIKQQNQALAQKFGVRGFPTIIILDSNGEFVAKTGYQKGGPVAYVELIKGLISKGKS